MITDALVNFVPIGSPLSLIAGAGVSIASQVIDLLGQGQGTAPQNIIGNRTLFGADVGIGGIRPQVEVLMYAALVAVGGSTLNIQFQAAPDTAVTFLPGTWQTLVETGPMTAAQLAIQQKAARFDFPPAFPENFQPRYLRLLFVPSAGGSFSAGSVLTPVTMVRDDTANRYMPANYAVAH